ncbi:MAG: hypothetical protein J7M25_11420 [Deltaproteobacteria bacterium]|nr:hypothetical protein [Deltaproteobacteria bacterium]
MAFYAYLSVSAHTGYEAAGRSVAFLYRDYDTGILSLFVIHGVDRDSTQQVQVTAEVHFDLTGFPSGTTLNRSDDAGEFTQTSSTSYQGQWWFRYNTDGGVVSDIAFPSDWLIVIHPSWDYGLDEWVWVDDQNQFHSLDMDKDLYIEATRTQVSCRADCTLPRCGDGILDPGEVCDDGNQAGGDGCSADCTSMP